ncbi:MAG: hypothetical protein GY806_19980, partial [Gammaproteobacteria bacterium]|nr:hypothetical protein [Gammaproteobacteria bacterium]
MPTTIRTNFLNNLNDIQKWKGMIQKRANITAVDDPDHVLLSVIDQF